MNRPLALTLLTTITAVPAIGFAGTAGAADPLCSSEHAAENVAFTVADGVANLTATARPGCEGTPFGIAGYATAHLAFDPTETQPLLAHTSVDTVLGVAPVTVTFSVPQSTIDGRCRVQVDAYVGAPLAEISPTSRYNELAIGGTVNRLIGARHVDQDCATPPPVETTLPPVEDTPPLVEVTATPTPAPLPDEPPVALSAAPPVALTAAPVVPLTATQMDMLPVTGSARALPMIAAGFAMVAAGIVCRLPNRRNRKAGK